MHACIQILLIRISEPKQILHKNFQPEFNYGLPLCNACPPEETQECDLSQITILLPNLSYIFIYIYANILYHTPFFKPKLWLTSIFIPLSSFTWIFTTVKKKGYCIYSQRNENPEAEKTTADKLWEGTEITPVTCHEREEKRPATLVSRAKPLIA